MALALKTEIYTWGEWPHTYAYRKVIDARLKSVGFPAIVGCKYVPKTARYDTLEGNCLCNETLPSLASRRSEEEKAEHRACRRWLSQAGKRCDAR